MLLKKHPYDANITVYRGVFIYTEMVTGGDEENRILCGLQSNSEC